MSFIRERPSLRLHATIATPGGAIYRWGSDEDLPTNTPRDLTFSTTMPGGFDQCSLTLPRKSGIDYSDLAEFSTASILGLGGSATAWQGRLERTPRVLGDQMAVSPGLVGWQAHLDDNKSAREIYVDIDMTRWQGMSSARKIAIGSSWNVADGTLDQGATPAIALRMDGPWASKPISCEMWYDARSLPVALLWYAWNLPAGNNINPADTNWVFQAGASDDDITSHTDLSGNLRAAGPGTGSVTATGTRKFAYLQLAYTIAGGLAGYTYTLDWSNLTIIGNHGIGFGGSWGATPGTAGPTASQVITHAVAKYAPRLLTKRAGTSTITASGFLIPHLTFFDATTCSDIITQANKYELYDWWVDEGPTFNYAQRGSYGRNWRARVGPSKLSETGPQVDKIWNGVIVTYNDTSNVSRTVGPPGSGANTEDNNLVDLDPANPANAVPNLRRWTGLQMGTGTSASAIRIGQMFLAQQKQLNTSGDATLVGHVEDDHGVLWPAWMVRAGDMITFVDAHDPVPRRIVKTEYTDATKSCQISLDSPPESLQAYLDRLSVSVQSLGFT